MNAGFLDWDDLRYRLYERRAEIQRSGHDWDVADVVDVVRQWAQETA
ncbi:MAG TPA: hypothetical protein VGK35_14015 [Actinotalea sp.]|jgi:hypothetical protein